MLSKSELKEKNKAAGSFFFSRDTMRFFASRLETGGYYGWQDYEYSEGGTFGWYFVYSNQFTDGRGVSFNREYKVAFMREDGKVSTVNRPSFDNLREAHQTAKTLAAASVKQTVVR